MMRHLLRGSTMLLLLGLAGLSWALGEMRFAVAGALICGLVEIGLALRARREKQQAPRDRSRLCAAQVSCTEQDGALSVALVGESEGRGGAPYVLLSRKLRTERHAGELNDDRPSIELSNPKWSIQGGIQDAYLTPRLLRLTLDARGAELLGIDQLCVTFEARNDQRQLERALSRILRGVPFTSERSMPEDAPPGLG
jgi:hypothetical protein